MHTSSSLHILPAVACTVLLAASANAVVTFNEKNLNLQRVLAPEDGEICSFWLAKET